MIDPSYENPAERVSTPRSIIHNGERVFAHEVLSDEDLIAYAAEDIAREEGWTVESDPAESHQIQTADLCVTCEAAEIWDGDTQRCESCWDAMRYDRG